MTKLRAIIFSIFATALAFGAAENYVINKNAVYISERATLQEFRAAQELSAVFKMGSPEWERPRIGEIRNIRELPPRGVIIATADAPLIADYADELFNEVRGKKHILDAKGRVQKEFADDDIIAHAVIDGCLILAGTNPRAALYATYDFAQRWLGTRWLWPSKGFVPGEEGEGTFYGRWEKIPADLHFVYKPPFRFRLFATRDDAGIWSARNFTQVGSYEFGGERITGGESIQPERPDYKVHPEYFALFKNYTSKDPWTTNLVFEAGGVRYLPPPQGWSWIINGCWSNKDFTDLCIKRIKGRIVNDNANHVSIHAADTARRCECDECEKMIPNTGNRKADLSARWYKYHAEIVREIKKDFPNIRYSVLGYHEYKEVPSCEVEEVEFVEYCQYCRCYIHKVGNKDCSTNKKDFDVLQEWRAKSKSQAGGKHPFGVGAWDYSFDLFSSSYNVPFYSYFDDLMKYYHTNELVKVFLECGPSFAKSRVAAWVAAQLLWDPTRDADKLLEDYCRTAYAGDWQPMYRWHRATAEQWEAMPLHLSQCFNNAGGTALGYITTNIIALAEETFAKCNTNNVAVAFELETYNEWKKLRDQMASEAVFLNVYQDLSGEGEKLCAKHGEAKLRGTCNFAWDESALSLVVDCEGSDEEAPKFEKREGAPWEHDSIEIFIMPDGCTEYFHLAINRAGEYYSGKGMGVKDNYPYDFSIEERGKGEWCANIKIPYSSLGVATPQPNTQWKFMVIRNHDAQATGYPTVKHHDIGAGATIIFSAGKRP